MKRFLGLLSLAILCPTAASWAQLFPPNEAGVSLGQYHAIVRDMDAAKKFWTVLGAAPIKVDGTEVMKFAGVLVFLTPGTPSGGTEGTVVDHVGFGVPDVRKALATLKAAGMKVREPGPNGSPLNGLPVGDAWSPDNLMVELETVQTLTTPCAIVACIPYLDKWPASEIASNHIHFHVPVTIREQMQAWYAKMFSATPGVLGDNLTGELPGVRYIRWTAKVPAGETTLPIKGRALDYIGFEIKNLESFCKKLEAKGVKFDGPYSKSRHKSFASAQFTDPWGVSIELTEGLNRF
jgi:catechol 2,3-dioxygenase-like lactoylglutathione lyase family enzyme